jgi:hypothetical protein
MHGHRAILTLTAIGLLCTTPRQARAETCSAVPTNIQYAFNTARDFRHSCPLAQKYPARTNVAVSDFSQANGGTPYMFVFDKDGACLGKFKAGFGAGVKRRSGRKPLSSAPVPSNATDSYLTPEGMHLTREIESSSKFRGTDAMLEDGLEGQASASRYVYIHKVQHPGTAVTEGCTGLSEADLKEVKKLLGVGSVVYNYFGSAISDSHERANAVCTRDASTEKSRRLNQSLWQKPRPSDNAPGNNGASLQ